MTSTTAAGTALAITAGVPATLDAAGYAALTYTEVGGIDKIGAIGATTAKVEFQPLNGAKEKHKGSTDYGSLAPTMAYDKADAGQTLLRTASDPSNNALYAFKATYPNGDVRYFRSRVFGYPETIDGADSIITAAPTIEITSPIVKVNAA
jgi:hypothetical protein